MVTTLKKRKTRRGDWMAVFMLEDLEGSVEVVVFPELLQVLPGPAGGRYRRGGEGKGGAGGRPLPDHREEVSLLAGAAERRANRVVLEVNASGLQTERVTQVRQLLRDHPGECPVEIRLLQPGGYRLTLRPDPRLRVGPSPTLTAALEQVLGKGSVLFR